MLQVTLFFGWLTLVALVAAGWRGMRQRELAWQRLAEVDGRLAPQDPVRVGTRRLHRRWIWAPWALALAVATVVALVFQLSMPYVVALGLMFGLLASQIESFLAARHVAVLETQLADAIDIMIGAVGAGASVGTAIEAAITECRSPLRPYLEEVAGRIRLGDEPAEVFRSLAQRVPLETFLLFTSALSVHWEVGGKLSSTLTTVGRTIRDRIDISRRIRSNTAQSQFSTLAIVGLTYFIAVIVWRNGPDQMEDFVRSPIGSWFVAGSVILQAVGIVWMNLISKPRF
ncbi:MAG: type II secretion system F family protein [Planctomycetales bacterium]|nr:type II secretion system F family protein [Planctomycetales bacterium]